MVLWRIECILAGYTNKIFRTLFSWHKLCRPDGHFGPFLCLACSVNREIECKKWLFHRPKKCRKTCSKLLYAMFVRRIKHILAIYTNKKIFDTCCMKHFWSAGWPILCLAWTVPFSPTPKSASRHRKLRGAFYFFFEETQWKQRSIFLLFLRSKNNKKIDLCFCCVSEKKK